MKCKYQESCGYDVCIPEDCSEYEAATMTNSDKIRAMSDEEMADLMIGYDELDERIHFCQSLPECEEWLETPDGILEHKCKDCLLKWLQQPAKEE